MAEAGNTLSEKSVYSDEGADAVVQMGEGGLGVEVGALTIAGSSAAPVVGSLGAGVMLGRRGDEKSKDYGIAGVHGLAQDLRGGAASAYLGVKPAPTSRGSSTSHPVLTDL